MRKTSIVFSHPNFLGNWGFSQGECRDAWLSRRGYCHFKQNTALFLLRCGIDRPERFLSNPPAEKRK